MWADENAHATVESKFNISFGNHFIRYHYFNFYRHHKAIVLSAKWNGAPAYFFGASGNILNYKSSKILPAKFQIL